MSEANKQLVIEAMDHLSHRRLEPLFAMIHEDGTWGIPYREDRFEYAGIRDKAGTVEQLTGFLAAFDSFVYAIEKITAEGDTVMVEATSVGVGPGTARYENRYMKSFVIRDGKLFAVREYLDPFAVYAYIEQLTAG